MAAAANVGRSNDLLRCARYRVEFDPV